MKRLFLIYFFTVLIGIGNSAVASDSKSAVLFKEANTAALAERYRRGDLGKLVVWGGDGLKAASDINIVAAGKTYVITRMMKNMGKLRAGEALEVYLPPGDYSIFIYQAGGSASSISFSVKGGESLIYEWSNSANLPQKIDAIGVGVKSVSSGSLMSYSEIDAYLKEVYITEKMPIFRVDYDYGAEVGESIKLKLWIRDFGKIKKLFVNDSDKSELLVSESIEVNEKLKYGKNDVVVRLVSSEGFEEKKVISLYRLSEAEKLIKEKEILDKKNEEERIAREGDGSAEDLLCKKYGFKPQTNGYAECRMKIDFAQAESKRQQEQYEREQAEYQRQLAAIEREKERRRGAAFLELGARMMGGQSPINALGSLGTGAPIAPSRPAPINQTITLPGGRMINCTTMGTMTNCF